MNTQKSNHWNRKSSRELLLLFLPGGLLTFLFGYMTLPGIAMAFQNFSQKSRSSGTGYLSAFFGGKFIGLDNFRFIFQTDSAWRITRNTIGMNLLFMVFGMVVCVAIALLLFEISGTRRARLYQSSIILPHFLSWVVVSFMFYGFMSSSYGIFNNLLQSAGLQRVDWYSEPGYWPALLLSAKLWKEAGFGSIIYFAALMGIGKEYFESAKIDGATRWQMTRYISLPFLLPLVTIMILLELRNIIRADFGLFYQLTRDVDLLYETTDVIDTFVYRTLKGTTMNIGMATAAGLYQSTVGFVLIVASNAIVKRIRPENALF